MEQEIRTALKEGGIECSNIVEVDPVENDWLITGVTKAKERPKPGPAKIEGHTVAPGKSIIRRLEDLADSDFKRYMKVGRDYKEEISDVVAMRAMSKSVEHLDSRIEGICEALAVMKNSSRGVEYEAVLDRYQNEITMGEARPDRFMSGNMEIQ